MLLKNWFASVIMWYNFHLKSQQNDECGGQQRTFSLDIMIKRLLLSAWPNFKCSSYSYAHNSVQGILQITRRLLWGVFSFGQMFRDVQNMPVILVIFRMSHTVVHCHFDYSFSVGFNHPQVPTEVFLLHSRYWMEGYRLQKIEQRQKWLFKIKTPKSPLDFNFAFEHAFSAVKYSQVKFLQLSSTSRRVLRASWPMKLVSERDLCKRQTAGGGKILRIKCLYNQDRRATQPNLTGVFFFMFLLKMSICCLSKPKYIGLEGRKQEKEKGCVFPELVFAFNLHGHFERCPAQSPFPTGSA